MREHLNREKPVQGLTAQEASQRLKARLVGDERFLIEGVGAPESATPHVACFIEAEKYLPLFRTSSALCWVISPLIFDRLEKRELENRVFLITEKPYLKFVNLINHFFPSKKVVGASHPQAWIDPSAEVHPSAQIEAFVSVGPRSKIGAQVVLHSGVWIDEGAVVGDGSILYAGVKVYHHCVIGKRNILHAGCVVGSDGFGFVPDADDSEMVKIPQIGRAILHDDVEVGANSTIDRGTLEDTVIGQGTKIDNLVQIGHNCKVGMNCILCAFVGLSGNTTLGNNVLMAGQSASKGHLTIGDNVKVGGQSGVSKDVAAGLHIKGYPARDVKDALKAQVLITKLPEIYKRLMDVEKKIKTS